MLNEPAASAAPVPPAHTSACALTVGDRARGLHDRGLGRRAGGAHRIGALGDRDGRVHHLHALGQLAQLRRPDRTGSRAPPAPPRSPRPPRPRPDRGPRRCSRRRPPADASSSAGTGEDECPRTPRPRYSSSCSCSCSWLCARASRPRGPRRCRTPGTPGAGLRGLWHCGHAFIAGVPILCCARRLAVRLCDCFFLGTAIASRRLPARRAAYSSFSSRSFAQRGSGAASWWCSGPALVEIGRADRDTARRSPRGRAPSTGAASAKASRAHAARSSVSSRTYGLSSSSPPPGLSTSRASTSTTGAASFRQRMHGPASAAAKRSLSA